MRTHDTSIVSAAVGRAIRARRKQIKRTSSSIAHDAHIDRTYLSQIERGLRQPTINIFLKIAGQLRIRPERLLGQVLSEMGDAIPEQEEAQPERDGQPDA